MGKKYCLFGILFTVILLLTGCGNAGRLDEGDCPVEVKLEALPQSFAALSEDAREQITLQFTLTNDISEKRYEFVLTEENGFSQKALLHPGTYRVSSCFVTGTSAVSLDAAADQESYEIQRDQENRIELSITNEGEFNQWVAQMWVDPAIRKASQFSEQVQFEGQVIDLKQIADYVEFENDTQVGAHQKAVLYNGEKGVHITVLNEGDDAKNWWECRVIEVCFTKDNVIFGQGVRVRMPASEVLHNEAGIYGTPARLDGCVLIGLAYGDFYAVYNDGATGDRMTMKVDSYGKRITEIDYEFEVFE